MFATLITTTLFRAGFKAAYLANPAPKPGPVAPVINFGTEFDPAVLESAVALYVPSIGKCVTVGEEGWPEDAATGLLTADVLMIEHLQEIAPHSDTWGVEYMAEGSWEDVKNDAAAIHEIVAQSFADWHGCEKSRRERGQRGCPPRDLDALDYRCEFIGLWEPETSLDWESGHTDIDAINFAGEGRIVPVQPDAIAEAKTEKHLDLLG